MQLAVIVATLEGCPFDRIDDAPFIEHVIHEATAAGGLTTLQLHVHKFEPQGVTAAAVLSESHLALHSWPEEGILFVDLATCAGAASAQRAFDRICALVPHEAVKRQELAYTAKKSWTLGLRNLFLRSVG